MLQSRAKYNLGDVVKHRKHPFRGVAFVHYSEIQTDGGFATLNDGQEVEYEVGQGQKGPCANKVVPL